MNYETLPQPIQQAVNEYLWRLLRSYGPIGLLLVVVPPLLLWFVLRKTIEGEVEKEVNKHKADIEYKYGRGIENYKLYIDKKHKVYTEVSELLTKTQSAIFGLEGLKQYPSISEFDGDDLKEYLENCNLTRKKVNEFVDKLRRTTSAKEVAELQGEITKYLYEIERVTARREHDKAKSHFWLNSIYFSPSLPEKIESLLGKMSTLLRKYEYPIISDGHGVGKEIIDKERREKEQLKKGILREVDEIVEIMKKELSAGYYDKG